MSQTMADHVRHLQERLKEAEAERDAYREALRPFAEHARGRGSVDISDAFARAAELLDANYNAELREVIRHGPGSS